jgi:protoporphyrinogen oxidase
MMNPIDITTNNSLNIAIVGGGIMGISLGYFLSQAGHSVEIFEASPILGGLAGPMYLEDGTAIDRFYHAILSSDSHLRELCEELGISDQLRFKETRMGFYHNGQIYSMNNIIEFLRFPPLGWIDRFRLGVTVLAAQFIKDWHNLEGVSVEKWLIRLGGRNTYENIWRPMLNAKFDGGFENVPATYIWSRLVRMKSTRGGASQKEEAGHLIGGYITLINAMAKKIEAAGGKIHLKTPIKNIVIENNSATGLQLNDDTKKYDGVIATLQTSIFTRLIQGADAKYVEDLSKINYLGVIAPLLVLNRELTGFWTLNITDTHFPFTGVIETTTYIDPKYVGGHRLVYLPKYVGPENQWMKKTDDEIRDIWLQNLEKMFPKFDRSWINYFLVHRERYVEPLHGLNETDLVPGVITPIKNLYLVTTAQIYPALTNGESVTRHARQSAKDVIKNMLYQEQD